MRSFFFLILIFTFSSANASSWIKITESDPDYEAYFNKDTIKYIHFGKSEAWIKEFQKDNFAISKILLDCDRDTYKYLSVNVYNKSNNKLIKKNTNGFRNINPVPETVGYEILSTICEESIAKEALKQANIPKRSDFSSQEDFAKQAFNNFGLDYSRSTNEQIEVLNKGVDEAKKTHPTYKSALILLKTIDDLRYMQKKDLKN
jgi:hypothetical protein